MFQFEVLFLMQAGMGILMVIMLRKIVQIKKQINKVVKEVEEYITFITEEAEQEEVHQQANKLEESYETKNISKKSQNNYVKNESRDDAQTQLLQAVLGEYFP